MRGFIRILLLAVGLTARAEPPMPVTVGGVVNPPTNGCVVVGTVWNLQAVTNTGLSVSGQVSFSGSIESFETGDFSYWPWMPIPSWEVPWNVNTAVVHSGTYSAESESVTNVGKRSTMKIALNCSSGTVSFVCKVSVAPNAGYLEFYVDGKRTNLWTGVTGWMTNSCQVAAGPHLFMWSFIKTSPVMIGSDRAWVDQIQIPLVPMPATWVGEMDSSANTSVLLGSEQMLTLSAENDPGQLSHTGYYAVINQKLLGDDPAVFNPVTLRPVPIPQAAADAQAYLTWDAAVQDEGDGGSTNIVGYDVYRSADGSNFSCVASCDTGCRALTNDIPADTPYCYALGLVFRGSPEVPSPVLSARSNFVSKDSDADTLPDWWEVRHFGNAFDALPGEDSDVDGLTNAAELGFGTNPRLKDSDYDGVEDAQEIAAGTNPVDPFYRVSFDAQGGAVSPAYKYVTLGLQYGEIPAAVRTGYVFAGWWTGSGGTGYQVTSGATMTSEADQTLFAKWVRSVTVATTGGATAVAEGGGSDTYTVVLDAQPASDVAIAVMPSGDMEVSPDVLTFTPGNWATPQTVTVTAVDDPIREGPHSSRIEHAAGSSDPAYDDIDIPDMVVAVADNEPAMWSGFSADDSRWLTDANWDGAPPVPGDALVFDWSERLANVNDMPAGMTVSGIGFGENAGAFTLSGNPITLAGSLVNLSGADQSVDLPLVVDAVRTFCASNGPVTVNGAIGGAGGVAKTGQAKLTLTAENTYDGPTLVSNGTLRVRNGLALGATNGATVVAGGGRVEIGGGVSVPEPVTLKGDDGSGALVSADGTNVWEGKITQTVPSRIRVLPGSALTLAGGLSGGTTVYLSPEAGADLSVCGSPVSLGSSGKICANGAGVVTLGGGGHIFGTLEVAGLTVRADDLGVLPPAAILSVGSAYSPDGTFDLNGNSQTVSQLKRGITSPGTRVVTSAEPASLTVSGSTSTLYDGRLAGAMGLEKKGISTLTLYGASNTYSGNTIVWAGTLEVSYLSSLGKSLSVKVAGGTLRLRNPDSVSDAAILSVADGAKVRIDTGVETVGVLVVGGTVRSGTWGATGSAAENVDDAHFLGAGVISCGPATASTPFPVPLAWMDRYPELLGLAGGDYEAAALSDADGDGHALWQEYLADTDPTNRFSQLELTGIRLVYGGAQVGWKGGVQASQWLEAKYDLGNTGEQWVAIFTNLPPTATATNVLDSGATNAMRFYRIRAGR